MSPTQPSVHEIVIDKEIEPYQEETETRQLFNHAVQEALSLSQRQALLCDIQSQPRVIYSLGLTPTKLPSLVENNPLVAIEILLRLMKKRDIAEYLDVMVHMDISVNCMEVVNRYVHTNNNFSEKFKIPDKIVKGLIGK